MLALTWRYSPSTFTPNFSYGGCGVLMARDRSRTYSSRLLTDTDSPAWLRLRYPISLMRRLVAYGSYEVSCESRGRVTLRPRRKELHTTGDTPNRYSTSQPCRR